MDSEKGLILLKKPAGVTSFSALRPVKEALGTGKIGHTGTLDKFADGLLVLLAGKFTKFSPYFTGLDKEYEAVFEFGKETDTLDPEGQMVATASVPEESTIQHVISSFTGTIRQVPPEYSAVHAGGERAHRLARKGEKPVLQSRDVTVYSIDVMEYRKPFLSVKVSCSKGTYIRSLARDIGRACGSRAYVTNLTRSRVGSFSVYDAVAPDEFHPEMMMQVSDFVDRIPGMAKLVLKESERERTLHGIVPDDSFFTEPPQEDGVYAVFSEEGKFLCLLERTDSRFSFRFIR